MNTSVDLGKEFTRERKRRNYTMAEVANLLGVAQSMIAHIEAGGAKFSTTEKYLKRLRELAPKAAAENPYSKEQLQALRERRNAALREFNRLNKIVRYAEAGKPIEYLLQEGDKK